MPDVPDDALARWFGDRIPAGWFTGPPEIKADADEVLVVGTLPSVDGGRVAEETRIAAFRQESRDRRMRIAAEAERRFGRKVSWGAACGATRAVFTSVSLPVMTRLRLDERAVLDTRVESGVARSRSHALAWCVRLVGRHQADWIRELRTALAHVEKVRAEGPR